MHSRLAPLLQDAFAGAAQTAILSASRTFMAWLQLRVHSRHPEFADEILHAHDAKAVSFVDAVDDPVLEPAPGETRLWANTVTLGLFVDGADLAPVQASQIGTASVMARVGPYR